MSRQKPREIKVSNFEEQEKEVLQNFQYDLVLHSARLNIVQKALEEKGIEIKMSPAYNINNTGHSRGGMHFVEKTINNIGWDLQHEERKHCQRFKELPDLLQYVETNFL